MRTYTILSLLLLLSEGLPVVVFAENLTVTVGEDFTEECWFYTPGSKKIFCKNDCNKEEDILVNTTKDRAENGRYSIQYEEETNIMSVRIEKVQMSDSGQYQCKLETILSNIWWVKDVSDEFKIQVTEDFSDLYVINGTTIRPEHESQSPAPHDSPPSGSLLFVALAVAGVLLLVSAALVVFYCKKRVNRPQGESEIFTYL
ncbi:CMRF35-like molecule 2 isoform X3 [Boleophthalmus pectinirostris]|uniref:CMRF35-like molecule 2 isoform X3 n=1 Tax=Boleophthalmus pectinirostris TaxID=150288 RepID=UPI00242CE882|nr:CMRF35-like molecule 2 isoform X3 [Boleophthalmus pectinirostris]